MVLDDELLPEPLGELLPDEARHHVGRAAGRERHDDAHDLVRVGLREGRAGKQRGAKRRDPDDRPHRASPPGALLRAAMRSALPGPAKSPQKWRLWPKEINYSDPIARGSAPRKRLTALMSFRASRPARSGDTGRVHAPPRRRAGRCCCCRRLAAAGGRYRCAGSAAPKEIILGWINTYRHHPDPERVPLAVRGMSRLGLITDPEGSGVYVGLSRRRHRGQSRQGR